MQSTALSPSVSLATSFRWRPARGILRRPSRLRAETETTDEGSPVEATQTQSTAPVSLVYVEQEEPFTVSRISFGTILSPIGVGLMVFGFCAYFNFIPGASESMRNLVMECIGGDISPLMLVYGFPLSLLGFALKYAELKPVPCKSTQEALDLRETQMTDIQKQVREDTTRYRYGDEQHLDEALDRIFRFGRSGQIPRRLAPVLTGLREETRQLANIDTPQYTLILEFNAELTQDQWSSKLDKFQSFFGPGIVANLVTRDDGADVELICDGTKAGRTGVEQKDVLPPLQLGLPPRRQD